MNRSTAFLFVLCSSVAAARPNVSVIRFKAPSDPDERPTATEISVAPQGSDYALRVVFNKGPWGDGCRNRCANTTVFVDTDHNKSTGLQLGPRAPETGADLAVTLQGSRDYGEGHSRPVFRAKVRFLVDGAKSLEEGESLSELDPERDSDRLQIEENTVYVLVDASSARLPSGRTARVVYHPPGARALVSNIRGMLASGSGGSRVEVFKKGVRDTRKRH